jgi:putative Mn2+ efflux pump MntP
MSSGRPSFVRLIGVATTALLLAFASVCLVDFLGAKAFADWGKYVGAFFVFGAGLLVALIVNTFGVQNIESLTTEQRQSIRTVVRRRTDALWSLFALNVIGLVVALASVLVGADLSMQRAVASVLVFFLFVVVISMFTLPHWYYELERFKSLAIEQERARKARSELLKQMQKTADTGYIADPDLEQYNKTLPTA